MSLYHCKVSKCPCIMVKYQCITRDKVTTNAAVSGHRRHKSHELQGSLKDTGV